MNNWLSRIWNAYRRRIDIKIFWPACKRANFEIEKARYIFALHTFSDPAWSDLSKKKIRAIIEDLQ